MKHKSASDFQRETLHWLSLSNKCKLNLIMQFIRCIFISYKVKNSILNIWCYIPKLANHFSVHDYVSRNLNIEFYRSWNIIWTVVFRCVAVYQILDWAQRGTKSH
jgi:hypothetical protein